VIDRENVWVDIDFVDNLEPGETPTGSRVGLVGDACQVLHDLHMRDIMRFSPAFKKWFPSGPRGKPVVVPMSYLARGMAYEVQGRFAKIAVYDGGGGFLTLRHKFGHIYLDTEYHWDYAPGGEDVSGGTVRGGIDLGVRVPLEDIPDRSASYGKAVDVRSGRDVTFRLEHKRWAYADSGVVDHEIVATGEHCRKLFLFLLELEEAHG